MLVLLKIYDEQKSHVKLIHYMRHFMLKVITEISKGFCKMTYHSLYDRFIVAEVSENSPYETATTF